ncbi:MAG: B12-binding domain-containing radical SAM protein [Chloroflexi bacterium]|nr:B12-binding domain-containing radical SAM protein [Chloroflexota bacterium]
MASVLFIYPYFAPARDRSVFRFPPLGLGYLAAALRNAGHSVIIMDCTYLDRKDALGRAAQTRADVVGIYSMVTMQPESIRFARHLRGRCGLLVAGGPMPSCDPAAFLDDFDIVVRGEGERTMLDILRAYEGKGSYASISGIACKEDGRIVTTAARPLEADLDAIALPARDLFPNDRYMENGRKRSGRAVASIITTRGCPFHCEFCSNAVFGISYRQRSPENVVDEVEQVLSLGYDRVHFADDVFTLKKERLRGITEEILSRGLRFEWECLSRVDSLDRETAQAMREAGCRRVFFGIESASKPVLKLMGKKITPMRARDAVDAAREAGIEAGAFFILGYPGETDDTVLETLSFACSLPLDYLSFTVPYPLPGTALFERVKGRMKNEWRPRDSILSEHVLTFESDFSEKKLKFAILKGKAQFRINRALGRYAPLLERPFSALTAAAFRAMK